MIDKSQLKILVVEDTDAFAESAKVAFERHELVFAKTLDEAKELAAKNKLDCIISDVNFPKIEGISPTDNTKEMLDLALSDNLPIAFVTRADHHGIVQKLEEGFVAVAALTPADVMSSLMFLTGKDSTDPPFVRLLGNKHTFKSCEKQPEIWAFALDTLRNITVKNQSVLNQTLKMIGRNGIRFKVRNGEPLLDIEKTNKN